jgi:hypothetical protein
MERPVKALPMLHPLKTALPDPMSNPPRKIGEEAHRLVATASVPSLLIDRAA